MTTDNSDDELLTLTQAATLLGTSYSVVYQQVRWGLSLRYSHQQPVHAAYIRGGAISHRGIESLSREKVPSWQAKEANRITQMRRQSIADRR